MTLQYQLNIPLFYKERVGESCAGEVLDGSTFINPDIKETRPNLIAFVKFVRMSFATEAIDTSLPIWKMDKDRESRDKKTEDTHIVWTKYGYWLGKRL